MCVRPAYDSPASWLSAGSPPKLQQSSTDGSSGTITPSPTPTPHTPHTHHHHHHHSSLAGSGFTAKVAGTEMGVTAPQATFTPCYTASSLVYHPVSGLRSSVPCLRVPAHLPWLLSWWVLLRRCCSTAHTMTPRLPLPPPPPPTTHTHTHPVSLPQRQMRYAALLSQRLQQHGTQVWLVNTGWTAGGYGQGSRIPLEVTWAVVDAIHSGGWLGGWLGGWGQAGEAAVAAGGEPGK